MDYRILRQEESTDSNNNPEIFMSVEITDETGVYVRAEWLSPEDVARVQADASVADSIAEQIAQRAALAKQKPQQSFSATLLFQRMGQVFTMPQQIALGQMAPNFIGAVQIPDFTNIKQIINYIASQNPNLQPMADILKGLFLEQGIDLDTF